MKRRVFDLVPHQGALAIRHADMHDLTAPSLHQRKGKRIRLQRTERGKNPPLG